MKEDPIRLVLRIFSFFKRERERKITTIIFTSSSLEALLHLIQTCSHGDPHRTFKVNPIAARRCLGVRVCSSVCDCEQSEQRAGDQVCVCARARAGSARGEARAGSRTGARRGRSGDEEEEGGGRGGGESSSRRPVGLKVTRLVQKTASRKEVTEDEWEKENSSQPLKHRTTRRAAAPCFSPGAAAEDARRKLGLPRPRARSPGTLRASQQQSPSKVGIFPLTNRSSTLIAAPVTFPPLEHALAT
ncbi:uncharacterized protein LOC128591057 [Nycticebus coucang]|uniref:uncharacterized protein LOC128591057 n=1 Tax=Nycticebus coucang TaxID=9470 RepID=UPI00234D5628|nr:uncharacterized protein LOC128591057 [Nycticebus coucang]